jgi:truncated hemoglobin YjbI
MVSILLQPYLGTKELGQFLDQFYENVTQNDLVKHFFLLAKMPTIVQDLNRYWPYLMPKTALEYRKSPVETSSYEIQLPERQFSEISGIMMKLFRELKFNSEHAPQLIHEILEIIEETRSQTADTSPSVLNVKEVTPEKISLFLKRKIFSEVMPSKTIKTEKGLAHESWIRLDNEEKKFSFMEKYLSTIWHSIDLMVTGESEMFRVHEASQGAGQTRPVNSGKLFVE